jgi:hypothetical protein
MTKGNGPVAGLYRFEQLVNGLADVDVLHLRPGYFMENQYASIGMIKGMGINGGAIRGDLSPMTVCAACWSHPVSPTSTIKAACLSHASMPRRRTRPWTRSWSGTNDLDIQPDGAYQGTTGYYTWMVTASWSALTTLNTTPRHSTNTP